MATGKTEKSLKRKNEILEASLFTFTRKGYNATGIADIAERVGIGKSTVYEYFDSKADLFIETFRWFVLKSEEIFLAENKSKKNKSVKHQIAKRINQEFVTISAKRKKANVNIFHLVMEFKSSEITEKQRRNMIDAMKEGHEEFKNGIAFILKEGIKNGELKRSLNIQIVTELIISTNIGMNIQKHFDDKFNHDDVSKTFLKFLFAEISNDKK